MELPIVVPAPVVTEHAGVFRDLCENQCQFRHFQHYLTGLMVLPNKSMANIARCILDSAVFSLAQATPEIDRRWKRIQVIVVSGQKIVLNDSMAVCCVSELHAENLRILLSLLESIAGMLIFRLCFNNANRKIPLVPQKIVSTLLLLPGGFSARNENTPVGEALLFADLIVVPSSGIEPRENVFPAGICFVGA